jgi:hypothetical protein
MRPAIRPATPADGPAIAALLVETFALPRDHPGLEARGLHWKYWLERSDWTGPRSFVLQHGADIVAHAGAMPGSCAWQGGRIRTMHLIDLAARPHAIGAGVALMKHIGRKTDALLAIGGSAPLLAILATVGFQPFGEATGYVRPLRPLTRLMGAPKPTWRLAPQVVRSALWTATGMTRRARNWHIQRLGVEDILGAALSLPTPTAGMAVLERSPALFRYMLSCPSTPMALYRIDHGAGRARGYFLLSYAPGQARLADCWVDSGESEDWISLIRLALQTAKKDSQSAELVTLCNDAIISNALVACGFRARTISKVQMLATSGASIPGVGVRVQMLDNDSVFLHAGQPDFWA